MNNIISLWRRFTLITILLLLFILITGCSSDFSIIDKERNLDKSSIAAMHGDRFIRDIDIKNIKNFQLYVAQYNDGKLIKKQPLILSDEQDHRLHNLNVLLSLSFDFKDNQKFESHFFDGAVGTSVFYFKHKINLSTEELKSYYPNFTNGKTIILGGLYLEDDANDDIKTLETLSKKECILFMLEKDI